METKKKRTPRLKLVPLLAVLATALVVVVASLAPGWVLRLQEPGLGTGFFTVPLRDSRLDYDEDYYFAGAAMAWERRTSYGLDEWENVQSGDDIDKLPQYYEALADAGVIPEDFRDITYADELYGGLEYIASTFDLGVYNLFVCEAHQYAYDYVTPIRVYVDVEQQICYRGSFTLPYMTETAAEAIADGETNAFLVPYLESYIDYMGLAGANDWQIYSDYAYVEYYPRYIHANWEYSYRSQKAGVIVGVSLAYNDYNYELTTYEFYIYPSGYYY